MYFLKRWAIKKILGVLCSCSCNRLLGLLRRRFDCVIIAVFAKEKTQLSGHIGTSWSMLHFGRGESNPINRTVKCTNCNFHLPPPFSVSAVLSMLPAAAICVSISQTSSSLFHTLCFQKAVTKTPPGKLDDTLDGRVVWLLWLLWPLQSRWW